MPRGPSKGAPWCDPGCAGHARFPRRGYRRFTPTATVPFGQALTRRARPSRSPRSTTPVTSRGRTGQLHGGEHHLVAAERRSVGRAGLRRLASPARPVLDREHASRPQELVRPHQGPSEANFAGDLERFDIPTLLIHGEDDQVVPVTNSRHSARIVKDAKDIYYPGAPHGLTARHQDQVNGDLLTSLQGDPPAAGRVPRHERPARGLRDPRGRPGRCHRGPDRRSARSAVARCAGRRPRPAGRRTDPGWRAVWRRPYAGGDPQALGARLRPAQGTWLTVFTIDD